MKSLKAAIITLTLAATASVFAQADSMQGMGTDTAPVKNAKVTVHQAVGVVKSVDAGAGKVVLAHEPVKTLNWPAMTMTFGVKNKGMMDKLGVGKHVQVTFQKQGADFVITSVK